MGLWVFNGACAKLAYGNNVAQSSQPVPMQGDRVELTIRREKGRVKISGNNQLMVSMQVGEMPFNKLSLALAIDTKLYAISVTSFGSKR
jgi:hypothetical protein